MNPQAAKLQYFEQPPKAKPVMKWAGGKTQLLPIILKSAPTGLGSDIRSYIEPFFGGGAVFFELYNSGLIDEAIILDSNVELITLYKTIKQAPDDLIAVLGKISSEYLQLNEDGQKQYYYAVRDAFNANIKPVASVDAARAAHTIFLNRTCFNGLYRVNSKGGFNVPQGKYKNPRILDEDNILAVSQALQIADIQHADFTQAAKHTCKNTFVYYDPPYKPISATSHFTAYSGGFGDEEQKKLARLYTELHKLGVPQMLSNSDPFSASGDDFFEQLYKQFNISRIEAKRMINANAASRGNVYELLITNYDSN